MPSSIHDFNRILSEALPHMVWTARPDGTIDYTNHRCEEYTGSTDPANWANFVHPDDLERVKTVWAQSVSTGTPYECEFRILRKSDQMYRWHISKASPSRDAHGTIVRWLGSSTDVHEYKQLVEELRKARQTAIESEQRLRLIADHLPALVSYMGTDMRYRFVNKSYSDWFELPSDQIEGKTRAELLRNDEYAEILPHEAAAFAGQPSQMELTLTKPNGEIKIWDAHYIPDIDSATGRVRGVIGLGQDITERVQITRETQMAREAAENANATKSAFLANMSHEIRTPLGVILGFAAMLKDPNLTPEEREHHFEIISRNGQALTRIIDDILDLAKVEAGRLEIEAVDFSFQQLMKEMTVLFLDRAQEKGIYLRTEWRGTIPSTIRSDSTRLRQILINVIGNAVKFTERGGVDIVIEGTDVPGVAKTQFTIRVRDTGPGLSAEQAQRLFKPFSQADNTTTRRYGGTGLGLALSKRLSEALGGDIAIEDCTPQRGCTFVISFVAGCSQQPKADLAAQTSHANLQGALIGTRILVVEDSADNQFLIQKVLQRFGAKVDMASDGEEGVTTAMANSYDAVLMDIQMPKKDGYQATKELLGRGFTPPIVALTAHAMVEEREKTRMAGFSGHLTKPIDTSEMIATVAGLIRKTSHQSQNDISPDL